MTRSNHKNKETKQQRHFNESREEDNGSATANIQRSQSVLPRRPCAGQELQVVDAGVQVGGRPSPRVPPAHTTAPHAIACSRQALVANPGVVSVGDKHSKVRSRQ